VLHILHSEKFVDQAPQEVYAALLDEGQYLCSIRTMYRLLEAHQEVKERRDQLRHPFIRSLSFWPRQPTRFVLGYHQVVGAGKWTYFYLYVVLDIFSRTSWAG